MLIKTKMVDLRDKFIKKIKPYQIAVTGILTLVIISGFIPGINRNIGSLVNRHILGFEEVGSIENIGILFRRGQQADTVYHRIMDASQRLRKILGPPSFEGKIRVVTGGNLSYDDGKMSVSFLWPWIRTIEFVSPSVSNRLICHELVHGLYQSQAFVKHYPKLAVEGMSEAVAIQASQEPIPLLNPDYQDYYLRQISGLIDPDENLSQNPILSKLCYSISALYFDQIYQMDNALYTRLLYEVPKKQMSWDAFIQKLVDRSEHSVQLRDFINDCTVFKPLSQHFFAIPLVKKAGSVITILLYVDVLSSIEQRTLSVKITYRTNSEDTCELRILTFEKGVTEVHIQHQGLESPGQILFNIHLDGSDLETVFPIK